MLDTTLGCENNSCPAHTKCRRFLDAWAANLEHQAFAAFAPDKGKDRCEHYIATVPCDQPRGK